MIDFCTHLIVLVLSAWILSVMLIKEDAKIIYYYVFIFSVMLTLLLSSILTAFENGASLTEMFDFLGAYQYVLNAFGWELASWQPNLILGVNILLLLFGLFSKFRSTTKERDL